MQPLQGTATQASGKVVVLSADVATVDGRADIVASVGRAKVRYLIHGAGVLPIRRLREINPELWRQVMSTNVDAHLFLTQVLIPQLAGGRRLLFIGSMSASKARKGSTAYCTSMAASFMPHQCLRLELPARGIFVTSAIPGPVATHVIRDGIAADADVFPDGAEYAVLRQEGRRIAPAAVGRFYR